MLKLLTRLSTPYVQAYVYCNLRFFHQIARQEDSCAKQAENERNHKKIEVFFSNRLFSFTAKKNLLFHRFRLKHLSDNLIIEEVQVQTKKHEP